MNCKLEKFWNWGTIWKNLIPSTWTVNLKSFEIFNGEYGKGYDLDEL